MTRFTFSALSALILFSLLSCSGSKSPVSPPTPHGDALSSRSGLSLSIAAQAIDALPSRGHILPSEYDALRGTGHDLLGIWRARLWDDGRVDIFPLRTEQAHWNVKKMVMNCPTCFKVDLGPPPGPSMFDFNITLQNPTGIKGYDVTGIIRASGDIAFLNPDSYTLLFSYPGDTTPNPYAAWDTGVGNREFPGYSAHTEMLRFEKGGITKFGEIDFVIQASWPANQEEPYAIWGALAGADLLSDGSNQVELRCRVGDWQGNVDSVRIDLTPIGGSPNAEMSYLEENIWTLAGVSYSPTGQGAGDHRLKITATSNGVSTYNYLPVKVISTGPTKQGPFLIQYQNLPLEPPDGPTDGLDIAVMGAQDGTQVTMVFGEDDTYHFWSSDYRDGAFGLYYQTSGEPIKPFDLPNWRFDFADTDIPDSSVDSIFTLGWGEANTSTTVLDPASIPPVIARQRIALWNMTGDSLKLTANVLVLGADDGPPKTYKVIVRPIEFASGFRKDGLLYMALAFDSGDESEFQVVDVMALKPPLDFQDNPDIILGGYEAALDEGSGPLVVNRDAIVGIDVDDSGIMEITGGYAGHAWVAVAEAGAENALEIVDADIVPKTNSFTTVALPSPPKDVEILPLTNVGQPSNAICVLCADNKIRLYNYSGALLYTIGGSPYMTGSALRLDVDDTNLAIHVLHQGAQFPLITVYKWDG